MTYSILVTYASRAGSTAGVADAIGETLSARGFAVDVLPMQEVHDLSQYRAIVAGSAIRYDKWLPEATQFVEEHQHELQKKPFAAFLVSLAMATQNEKRKESARRTASGYLQPVRALVPTVSEGLFAGALNLSKLPLHLRLGFGLVARTGILKEGDHRDWNAIRAWANTLPDTFFAGTLAA